ncbi:uncharacterized protein BJ212DRAFT_1448906 [Suillus subaureus]|uniref:Uncharacterized protein n=1 Tax=Suillus subaureus TaxID=48587 RepID=A0A9P7E1T6_9AGAM|nr:uncharacterized protein BJ212DRAFT_1448906 [Suillus subaureus]KAG1808952.1 hypothetical protein BJ212DRAFT_1448906 [Suillus subaureus]
MGDCLMEGGNCWIELEMKMEQMLCPNCNGDFPSIEAVVLHLNSQSTCWLHEACPQQLPIPPREINTYYSFHDEGEWELARFLVKNLNQTQVDKFLKLKWPHRVNVRNQCKYGDYMSVDLAWKIQDHLPLDAMQIPIILGTTGGLEMHPVFITIGNLDSDFHVYPDYQTILQVWLWHKCVNLISKTGCFMSDPSRFICYVFIPLVAHVCDLPEACMIAAVSKNASPLTMALQENFGQHTLQLIYEISQTIDVWDLDKFQKAAKAVHLSGVHMPYWHDWRFAYPSVFLTGKILHTCLKFFTDHPLNWIKEVVGKPELNACFITQHKQKPYVKVACLGGLDHKGLASACTLCPFPEYVPLISEG